VTPVGSFGLSSGCVRGRDHARLALADLHEHGELSDVCRGSKRRWRRCSRTTPSDDNSGLRTPSSTTAEIRDEVSALHTEAGPGAADPLLIRDREACWACQRLPVVRIQSPRRRKRISWRCLTRGFASEPGAEAPPRARVRARRRSRDDRARSRAAVRRPLVDWAARAARHVSWLARDARRRMCSPTSRARAPVLEHEATGRTGSRSRCRTSPAMVTAPPRPGNRGASPRRHASSASADAWRDRRTHAVMEVRELPVAGRSKGPAPPRCPDEFDDGGFTRPRAPHGPPSARSSADDRRLESAEDRSART